MGLILCRRCRDDFYSIPCLTCLKFLGWESSQDLEIRDNSGNLYGDDDSRIDISKFTTRSYIKNGIDEKRLWAAKTRAYTIVHYGRDNESIMGWKYNEGTLLEWGM